MPEGASDVGISRDRDHARRGGHDQRTGARARPRPRSTASGRTRVPQRQCWRDVRPAARAVQSPTTASTPASEPRRDAAAHAAGVRVRRRVGGHRRRRRRRAQGHEHPRRRHRHLRRSGRAAQQLLLEPDRPRRLERRRRRSLQYMRRHLPADLGRGGVGRAGDRTRAAPRGSSASCRRSASTSSCSARSPSPRPTTCRSPRRSRTPAPQLVITALEITGISRLAQAFEQVGLPPEGPVLRRPDLRRAVPRARRLRRRRRHPRHHPPDHRGSGLEPAAGHVRRVVRSG